MFSCSLKSDFPNFHFPCSPKLVLFSCSLRIFLKVPLFPENKWTCSLVPPKPLGRTQYKLITALIRNSYLLRETTLRKLFLLPSEKGSALKGKNLLPTGSKFFPFRVDLFSANQYNGKLLLLPSEKGLL